jgi:glycosyltransferase involved in cell wall biosynthesis
MNSTIISAPPPHILFLGSTFAGHRTRFQNLKGHSSHDARIRATYRHQNGWRNGGVIERLPFLAGTVKGRLRTVMECAPFAMLPRPDVIWTSAGLALTPYLWCQLGRLRRPLVRDLDWTLEQQEALAPMYYGRRPRQGLALALLRLEDRLVSRSVSLFTPWSRWAADSLRRQGIGDERIRVLPPGVDMEQWQPRPGRRPAREGPLRLLFVGGDFARKGGPMLVDVFREHFAGRCELDIVTRDPVMPPDGVRVHRAEANSPLLRDLYARADLFVLPTRADCFGIAAVEAMASALPVIMSDVGGARDIVESGNTGWLIEPAHRPLAAAIEHALEIRDHLPILGQRARRVAEQRFDGKRNDALLLDLLIEAAERHRRDAAGWSLNTT